MKKQLSAAILLAGILLVPFQVQAASTPKIARGIYIQGIDVGGKTPTEAALMVNKFFQSLSDTGVQMVCVDQETETIPLSEWEFTWNTEDVINKALSYSGGGCLIRNYKNHMNLQYSNLYLETPFTLSEDAVRDSIQGLAYDHDNPAVNPIVSHHDDGFRIDANGKNGTVTDIAATVRKFRDTLSNVIYSNHTAPLKVEVVTQVDKPKFTASEVRQIKDRLGTFTTEYSESSDNRKTNVRVATEYLNGTFLMPGESCSVSQTIRPRQEQYGYKMAAQYSNGESEQDIGGGVCQVSTTLYNALIRAELQIDERHNHSMVVSYVEYGDDAAIATGSKDLVFTNNLSSPIFIEGIADDDYLTFSIYGTETRPDNRRIEFVAQTTKEKWPEKKDRKVKYDPTLPKGYEELSGTVRPEITATLTKVVYIDDEEVERELMHTDTYESSNYTITYGTKTSD